METRTSTVFVGRVPELAELERALHAAGEGSGATVLVAGEAGIGKTRLATELAKQARDRGFEVLIGRCIDLVGTELPYQPFVEALRPLEELRSASSQLRMFEETLGLLTDRGSSMRRTGSKRPQSRTASPRRTPRHPTSAPDSSPVS